MNQGSYNNGARSRVYQPDCCQTKTCPTPKPKGNYEFRYADGYSIGAVPYLLLKIYLYVHRYDDGYSASIGAVSCPLLMMQHSSKNDFVFKNPINPLERPLRILPPIQKPWWPESCYRKNFLEKPHSRPRYIGLHYDLTYPMPRECDVQHF